MGTLETFLVSQIRSAAMEALSPPRFRHSEGVVATAVQLCQRYGESTEKAEIAGWLHDIAREWSASALMQAAETIDVPTGFASIPALLHGPIAAHIGRSKFHIADMDVLNAVAYHTTGREEMSNFEKILFLADATEPGRLYPGVETLRALAFRSLDLALVESLDGMIHFLVDNRQMIFPLTVMARNAVLNRLEHASNVF